MATEVTAVRLLALTQDAGLRGPRLLAPATQAVHALLLTNLDKTLYPEDGFGKGEVINYYSRIAAVLLPHLAGRPVTFIRSASSKPTSRNSSTTTQSKDTRITRH